MKLLSQGDTHALLGAAKILVNMAEHYVYEGERDLSLSLADTAQRIALIVQSALRHDLIEEER